MENIPNIEKFRPLTPCTSVSFHKNQAAMQFSLFPSASMTK